MRKEILPIGGRVGHTDFIAIHFVVEEFRSKVETSKPKKLQIAKSVLSTIDNVRRYNVQLQTTGRHGDTDVNTGCLWSMHGRIGPLIATDSCKLQCR